MLRGDLRRAEREAARVSIAESEARHRLLLGSLPHGVVLQDAEGRLISANPAARTLLRAPEQGPAGPRSPGEPPVPRLPPDDRAPFPLEAEDRPALRALRTGKVQREVSFAVSGEDGRPAWVCVTSVPVLDGDGAPQAVVSAVTDGTVAREQESALRHAEEMFRLVCEHTPIGIGLLGLDGQFLRVNRMLCRQFGYRADELLQRGIHDLVHPEDADSTAVAIRRLLSGERESVQLERRYLGNGGMVVWGLLSLSTVRADDGLPLHLIAQLEDLSEVRRANELLTHLALHDPLTGLANRTTVLDRIGQALGRRRAHRAPGRRPVRRPGPLQGGQRQPGPRARRRRAGRGRPPARGRAAPRGPGRPARRRRVRRGLRGPRRARPRRSRWPSGSSRRSASRSTSAAGP